QALQQAQDAYDEAKVAVQGAENTLRLYGVSPGASLLQLADGRIEVPIVAPISGIVASRTMAVGQITDTSTPLLKIDNLDRVFVDAQVYEKDLADARVGDPVKVTVSAFPNRVFTGSVDAIGTEISPDTRTITVRSVVSNPGWLLRPGMFAAIHIGSLRGERSLAIPSEAVLEEGSRQVVFVETSPGTYVERTVVTGSVLNGRVPVRSGLHPGDQVVVAGGVLLQQEQQKLKSEQQGGA
ncbi:MAG TPA: efflux RND transporter periplasmic adaptor subunit, partial [Chthonomonadales bacterium]|nr:efflux RND transporter periplasmic adaptor subunit [Chthonomonadales bacterium]